MAIPEYCDERAKKHFHNYFVGETHGENGSSRRTSWSSTSGAKATAVHHLGHDAYYCAYCGNRAFPIQDKIDLHENYDVTGYCCVCKDAMDEVEWQMEYQALLDQQRKDRAALEAKAPKPTKEARHKVLVRRLSKLQVDIENDFFGKEALKSLNITLGHPKDHFKRED